MLEDVGAREGQVFVDLGSGTGKAVVAAALSGTKFLRCIGEWGDWLTQKVELEGYYSKFIIDVSFVGRY
jgi:hypothetical protein